MPHMAYLESNEAMNIPDQHIPVQYLDEAVDLLARVVPGGLAAVYQEEGLPLHFISRELLDRLGYADQVELNEAIDGLLLNAIHTDDRSRVLELLLLCGTDVYETEYRLRRRDGSYIWVRDQGKRIREASGRSVLFGVRMDITDTTVLRQELENKSQELEEYNRTLAVLTANVPGGVCEVSLDQDLTLLYANKSFFDFYGYTSDQMSTELHNKLVETVWPEDIELLKRTLEEAIAAGESGFEIEHRILRRDDALCWIFVRGSFSITEEKRSIHCVTVDITRRRAVEEELRMNEERFRIALAQTDNTIFDYDIRTKRMLHGDKSAEQYGLRQFTENVPDSLVECGLVHKDTANDFKEMYRSIQKGAPVASCVILARLESGEYVWRKITMTTIFDRDGNPVRAVGVLEDIDGQKRREEDLLYRIQRDTLTGLYNKGATEVLIREWLETTENQRNALFVIDIDEFKKINDRHGHLFGDRVLSESARRISALFHAEDVIGRIGGDEFIVFIKNLRDPAVVMQRVGEVCAAFFRSFEFGSDAAEISCSVGAALSPEHGQIFETLYQKADIALYDAKNRGKNRYSLYTPQMEEGLEWTPYSSTRIDR